MTFSTAANDTVEQRDFYQTHTAYRLANVKRQNLVVMSCVIWRLCPPSCGRRRYLFSTCGVAAEAYLYYYVHVAVVQTHVFCVLLLQVICQEKTRQLNCLHFGLR